MPLLSYDQLYNVSGVPKFSHLIVELCYARPERDQTKALFTLRNEKEGFISLKKLFVEHVASDPSEASFAEALFGDVGYWLRVRDAKELIQPLTNWREEAEVVRKSKAFKALVKEVEEDGKSSFSAAKYLIEEPWKDKRNPRVKKQSKATTSVASRQVKSDIERLKEEGLLQ